MARVTPAGVAQLVEQLIRNQQVVGSSPTAGSKIAKNLRDSCDPSRDGLNDHVAANRGRQSEPEALELAEPAYAV